MKSLALRALLAGLLIAVAADKVRTTRADPPDMRAAVVGLVSRSGWSAYEDTGKATEPLGNTIHFRAKGCEGSGQIFVIDLSLQAAPMLDHTIRSGNERRFVYLGRTWLTQDRIGMRLEWLKQKALALFGIGHYVVNEVALVIAEPRDCKVAGTIDWSALWQAPHAPGASSQQ